MANEIDKIRDFLKQDKRKEAILLVKTQLIGNGYLDKTFEIFIQHFTSKEQTNFLDELLKIKTKYATFIRNKSLMTDEQQRIELGKINNELIYLLNDFQTNDLKIATTPIKKKTIFISYNHGDKEFAKKLSLDLKKNGYEVIRDEEKMLVGESIASFIMDSIKLADVIISIVSTKSIMSAWVALETTTALTAELIGAKKFIPVLIDTSFFQPNFVSKASDHIEKETQKLRDEMIKLLNKKRGIDHLQDDLTRYSDSIHKLPTIVQQLKARLSLDMAGDKYTEALAKLLDTLKKI